MNGSHPDNFQWSRGLSCGAGEPLPPADETPYWVDEQWEARQRAGEPVK